MDRTIYGNPASEYLTDQGKRIQLAEALGSLIDTMVDLSTLLADMSHQTPSESEREWLLQQSCFASMNIQAEWISLLPMLLDIYDNHTPVPY